MLYKLVLKPLSWIYGLILKVRHIAYDRGFFYSKSFHQPIIKVGNLSLGGTGKSPFSSYIAHHYEDSIQCYILSRGYGRATTGAREVFVHSPFQDVGDEPLMMRRQLSKTRVFVSENRGEGIDVINQCSQDKKLIILDDALQHRKLAGGFQILLTEYSNPFYNDELLPLGKLRDHKSRARAIDLIVVTKSEESNHKSIREAIGAYSKAKVLFASIDYQVYIHWFTKKEAALNSEVVCVSALANSDLFIDRVSQHARIKKHYNYRDHDPFSKLELLEWLSYCQKNDISQIVVSEKDAVRLEEYRSIFEEAIMELIVLPIKIKFSEEDNTILFQELNHYIHQF